MTKIPMQTPFGAVYFRKSNPPREDWERDYGVAAEDGLNVFRHWFMWSAIERRPGFYDWEEYDRQMDLAAGLGQEHQLREHRQGLDVQADLPDGVEPGDVGSVRADAIASGWKRVQMKEHDPWLTCSSIFGVQGTPIGLAIHVSTSRKVCNNFGTIQAVLDSLRCAQNVLLHTSIWRDVYFQDLLRPRSWPLGGTRSSGLSCRG